MKIIITTILAMLFSLSVHSQGVFDSNSTVEKREQDLMNFIKSDMDLYSHYKSGEKNLKTGKALGYTSIAFMLAGGVSIFAATQTEGYDFILPLVLGMLSIITASAIGTIGTIFHFKGKGKIKDVLDYARGEVNNDYGVLKLETTTNGVGLVYTF